MDANTAVTLTNDVRDDMVRRKVTCPFFGSAVHQAFLDVRGDANNPLASIEDVRRWATAEAAILAGQGISRAKTQRFLVTARRY